MPSRRPYELANSRPMVLTATKRVVKGLKVSIYALNILYTPRNGQNMEMPHGENRSKGTAFRFCISSGFCVSQHIIHPFLFILVEMACSVIERVSPAKYCWCETQTLIFTT